MTCEEAANLISARLDGELAGEERVGLEAHLSECAGCRALAEAMAVTDAELRSGFAGRRAAALELAERVIAQMPRRARRRIPWLAMGLSAAAGFAVAFGVMRFKKAPMPRRGEVAMSHVMPTTLPSTQPAVGHLSLATGAVVFRCPGETQWSPMPTGGSLVAGTYVMTGDDVRCEIVTNDGSQIRLNANSEVCVQEARRFVLAGGEAWSTVARVPQKQPFCAAASDATFTALGTQFDLRLTEQRGVTLTVAEGKVKVDLAGAGATVDAGERVSLADGRLGEKQTAHDLAVATRWVNEILVMKGKDDPELGKRVDDLFAQIGQQKMSFMYEEEIRALGDHCVVPLTRYIQSDRSANDPAKRVTAAKIVSDVAPPWAIGELIGLLSDKDGEVRYWAAVALHRLTGRDIERTPEQWKSGPWMACVTSAETWQKWWEKNRERFPGAPVGKGEKESPVVKERVPLPKG